MTSYTAALKLKPKLMMPKLQELIEKKERILTVDIVYAIQYHDIEIIKLLLDNTPKSEHYSHFYSACVQYNNPVCYIKFLYDYGVPLNNSEVILFCNTHNKLQYVDHFVSLNEKLIDEYVVVEYCNDTLTFDFLLKLLKRHNIKLENLKMIFYGIHRYYEMDNKDCKEVIEKLFCQQEKKIPEFDVKESQIMIEQLDKLMEKNIMTYFTDTTYVTLNLICNALEYSKITPLQILLAKFNSKIPVEIIGHYKDTEKGILMTEHNKKID